MLDAVNQADEIPCTYDGGTWPYYVQLTGPIQVKNQFVYIQEEKGQFNYGFEKRYNTNKLDGIGSLEELSHHLAIILRSFKKVL
jgi:hypothetical protein